MNTTFNPAPLVAALQRLLPPARPLPLHEPTFAGREWEYVKECLDTGWVSSVGAYVDRFERMLAERLGVPHVVAVMNGTVALHVALLLAGVAAEDEVIVPALTFIATTNAVSYCRAVPHFADSCPHTLGLDPDALERHLAEVARREGGVCINRQTGRRIAAVAPMHVFGHPVDMDGLNAVAERWGLAVVEDAAESLGSSRNGRPAGSFSPLAALSFNGNKIITTGGGGAIAIRDPETARRARHLTTTAKLPHRWTYEHDTVGFNYRLPNLNAALGCAQLEQLDGFVAAKRALVQRYCDGLAGLDGVEMVMEPAGTTSNYWLAAIRLPDAAARDAALTATHAVGLLTRPAWGLMHRQRMYAECPRAPLPVAEMLEDRLVCLPSGVGAAGGPPASLTASGETAP